MGVAQIIQFPFNLQRENDIHQEIYIFSEMLMQSGQAHVNTSTRIAIISPSAPPLGGGGVASAHFNLFTILKSKGCAVKLFTFQDYQSINYESDGIIRRGTPSYIVKLVAVVSAVVFRFLSGSRVACEIKDILQSAIGALQVNKPLRQFRPEVLVLPDQAAPGFFIVKPQHCKTILISHHNPSRFLQEPFLRSEPDIRMAIYVENRVLKKVDSVICPSRYMKDTFCNTYKFNGPVTVLPNLIDDALIGAVTAFDINLELSLPEGTPVIYIPSAGSRLKGSQFIFEIVRRLAEFHCGAVGFYLSGDIDADLKFELRHIPDNAKLYMPGHVSYHENISLMKSCAFGISPTLIESFGMAIIEAMFCGIPMVTFDVGGNRDIIIDGENGFIVPLLDIENLIMYAQKLFDNQLRDYLTENALKDVRSRFDSSTLAEQFLDLVVK